MLSQCLLIAFGKLSCSTKANQTTAFLKMKAFIVALLVACVAAQNLDLLKLNRFNRPVYNELLKQKLGYQIENTFGDNVEVPTYLQEEIMDKKVFRLEEIIMTPLFREYMNLPIFRQFWTYPMFQRYVASTYFQRFWQLPAFQQYFVNPVLFYKYVYPMVTLFKYETMTTPTTTTTYGDILNKDFMLRNKNVLPFVYAQRDLVNQYYPTTLTQDKLYDQVFYKNLLEKLYSNLYTINKPIYNTNEFRQVFDQIKMIPQEQQTTLFGGKTFEPITGEYKMIDETVVPFEQLKKLETIYGEKIVKDLLLQKMLTKKMLPEIFGEETIKTVLPEQDMFVEKYNKMIPTTYKVNPLVARMLYGLNKEMPMINNFETEKMMLNKDIEQDLLPLYLQKQLINNKLQYNKIFDTEYKNFETTPKMVDITKFVPLTQEKPIMGVRTFDKKVMEKMTPEEIKY